MTPKAHLKTNKLFNSILYKKDGKLNPVGIVAAVMLATIALFWAVNLMTRGSWLPSSFFTYDGHYFGDDFYIPLASAQYADPWESGINYPAGAMLLYKVLYLLTPSAMRAPVGDSFYQTYYSSAIAMMLVYTASLLLFIIAVSRFFRSSQNLTIRILIISCIVLSFPVTYNYISGNCVTFAAALTAVFVAFYNSDSKAVRFFSYIILGFAATIKLYPAVFAWVVLFGRHRKEFLPSCAIVATIVILPFFYYSGLDSIIKFLSNLTSEAASKSDWGVGYNYSIQNLVKIFSLAFGSYYQGALSFIPKVAAVVFCFAVSSLVREDWKRLIALAMMFIWFFDYSYAYMLAFFIPSFCLSLNEASFKKRSTTLLVICLMLLLVPIATPGISSINSFFNESGMLPFVGEDGGTIYPLSYACLARNILLIIIMICLLVDALLSVRGYLYMRANRERIHK